MCGWDDDRAFVLLHFLAPAFFQRPRSYAWFFFTAVVVAKEAVGGGHITELQQ